MFGIRQPQYKQTFLQTKKFLCTLMDACLGGNKEAECPFQPSNGIEKQGT